MIKEKNGNAFIVSLIYLNIFGACLAFFTDNIPFVFPFFLLVSCILFSKKIIVINRDLLLLYLSCIVLAFASFGLNFNSIYISELSFLYFVLLYLPFVFVSKFDNLDVSDCFVFSILLISSAAILQFLAQELGFGFLYVGDLIPEGWHLAGYAPLYEYPYGSGLFKPNGFFLLEPSFLSQFVALGILVEFYNRRRVSVFCLLFISLLVSKSGTGFLILLSGALNEIARSSADNKVKIGSAISLIGIFVVLNVDLEFYLGRMGELDVEDSSGFIRFVAPFVNMIDIFSSADWGDYLFGLGPGAATRLYVTTEANYIYIVKSFIEYGGFFTIAVHWFLILFLIRAVEQVYALPLAVFLFVASGAMLQPLTVVMIYMFQFITTSNAHKLRG